MASNKLEELLQVLKDAYHSRMKKKFEKDQEKVKMLSDLALSIGESPLGFLKAMRALDDDSK